MTDDNGHMERFLTQKWDNNFPQQRLTQFKYIVSYVIMINE